MSQDSSSRRNVNQTPATKRIILPAVSRRRHMQSSDLKRTEIKAVPQKSLLKEASQNNKDSHGTRTSNAVTNASASPSVSATTRSKSSNTASGKTSTTSTTTLVTAKKVTMIDPASVPSSKAPNSDSNKYLDWSVDWVQVTPKHTDNDVANLVKTLASKRLNDYKLYMHHKKTDKKNNPAELIPSLENQGDKSDKPYTFMCKRNETQVYAGSLESMTTFLNNLKGPAKGPSKLSDIPSSPEPTW
ncbi:hypothetical protein PNOK_0632600 [Pyrrhoderma noxium]|uniref:Uncharacterized protein n=1 Tax=Pyrrhoderma noxium TaxID=2282107 RepID=A0A286UE24_9AGAM|nr:hypothetical protein PNOK_0632600 [Pyrrhoderma noxium]